MPWRCERLRSALEAGCWRPEGRRQRQHVWVRSRTILVQSNRARRLPHVGTVSCRRRACAQTLALIICDHRSPPTFKWSPSSGASACHTCASCGRLFCNRCDQRQYVWLRAAGIVFSTSGHESDPRSSSWLPPLLPFTPIGPAALYAAFPGTLGVLLDPR